MQGSLPCRNVEQKMSVEGESAARRRQLEEAEERKGEQKMVERQSKRRGRQRGTKDGVMMEWERRNNVWRSARRKVDMTDRRRRATKKKKKAQ